MLIMQLLNHGIPDALLDRVKELFKEYYKNSMDAEFQKSEIVGMLESAVSQGKNFSTTKIDADWETGMHFVRLLVRGANSKFFFME
jgi:hypothetical protein